MCDRISYRYRDKAKRPKVKFIYSEKATKFWEISTNYLTVRQITGGDFARPSQNIWTLNDKQKVVQNSLALPPPPSPPRLRLPPPPPGLFWGWHSLMGLPSSRLQAIWVRGFPRALYFRGGNYESSGFQSKVHMLLCPKSLLCRAKQTTCPKSLLF